MTAKNVEIEGAGDGYMVIVPLNACSVIENSIKYDREVTLRFIALTTWVAYTQTKSCHRIEYYNDNESKTIVGIGAANLNAC